MSPDTLARLAQMRRDRRIEWATFAFHAVGVASVFALVWWVTR